MLELCFAALPSGLLLSGYLTAFGGSSSAVAPHLQLLVLILLAPWVGVRLLFTANTRMRRWSFALLGTFVWLTCVAYAALALVGLQSWGRMVTWVLIETYLKDLTGLFEVLGLDWRHTFGLCLLAGLPLFALLARHLESDPLTALALRLPERTRWLLASGLLLIAPAQLIQFAEEPALAAGEPLALTFFSDRQGQALQSHT